MIGAAWHCDSALARLEIGPLAGSFCPTRPADGLGEVFLAGGRWPAARLCGLVAGDCPNLRAAKMGLSPSCQSAASAPALVECFCRRSALVTAYEHGTALQVRWDALWRAIRPTGDDSFLAALDLIVSVQTRLLDSRADLVVQSVLPATRAWRLEQTDPAQFVGLVISPDTLTPIAGQWPSCVLVHGPGNDWSYAEMVHPADSAGDELTVARSGSPGDAALRLRHRLLWQPLEKGVILRARVRGIFLPRQDDMRIAAACYRQFVVADPPLA